MNKPRYSLRNKEKIVKTFDEDFWNLLIKCLDDCFEGNNVNTHKIGAVTYDMLFAPNLDTDSEGFMFAVIREQYNCYNLAYYSKIE